MDNGVDNYAVILTVNNTEFQEVRIHYAELQRVVSKLYVCRFLESGKTATSVVHT